MDIYHNAKAALNDLLNQAVEEGITQEEIVYHIAKAVDDSVTAKRTAMRHRDDEILED